MKKYFTFLLFNLFIYSVLLGCNHKSKLKDIPNKINSIEKNANQSFDSAYLHSPRKFKLNARSPRKSKFKYLKDSKN